MKCSFLWTNNSKYKYQSVLWWPVEGPCKIPQVICTILLFWFDSDINPAATTMLSSKDRDNFNKKYIFYGSTNSTHCVNVWKSSFRELILNTRIVLNRVTSWWNLYYNTSCNQQTGWVTLSFKSQYHQHTENLHRWRLSPQVNSSFTLLFIYYFYIWANVKSNKSRE